MRKRIMWRTVVDHSSKQEHINTQNSHENKDLKIYCKGVRDTFSFIAKLKIILNVKIHTERRYVASMRICICVAMLLSICELARVVHVYTVYNLYEFRRYASWRRSTTLYTLRSFDVGYIDSKHSKNIQQYKISFNLIYKM